MLALPPEVLGDVLGEVLGEDVAPADGLGFDAVDDGLPEDGEDDFDAADLEVSFWPQAASATAATAAMSRDFIMNAILFR